MGWEQGPGLEISFSLSLTFKQRDFGFSSVSVSLLSRREEKINLLCLLARSTYWHAGTRPGGRSRG
jgi:hypothetical protein